jgi:hypothetical protein
MSFTGAQSNGLHPLSGASRFATLATVAPLRGPRPVSTTSVAFSPTTIPMFGQPTICQT